MKYEKTYYYKNYGNRVVLSKGSIFQIFNPYTNDTFYFVAEKNNNYFYITEITTGCTMCGGNGFKTIKNFIDFSSQYEYEYLTKLSENYYRYSACINNFKQLIKDYEKRTQIENTQVVFSDLYLQNL